LAAIPGKKTLMYFSGAVAGPGANDPAELQQAIDAAKEANVAIYPQAVAQSNPAGRAFVMEPAPAPRDEQGRRLAEARAKFGTNSPAMVRTYVMHGPPDTIEDRGQSQIWRYNYLSNFRSSAEFEFRPADKGVNIRINFPPPLAVYVGSPATTSKLDGASGSANQNVMEGLPGRHAQLQIYPTGEYPVLFVPLDSLTGRVSILGLINQVFDDGTLGPAVAGIRDDIQAAAGSFQANFIEKAGTYVLSLIVREPATGKIYGETIRFEVK
jgi:hypothetical protein